MGGRGKLLNAQVAIKGKNKVREGASRVDTDPYLPVHDLHVAHELDVQVLQASEEDLMRLLPPPIPKEEKSFWISQLPHRMQVRSFSPPIETRASNRCLQLVQVNS